MEKNLRFSYDPPSDELNIHFGEPRPAISKEIDDEVYLRLDPHSREIVGVTVLHFRRRFRSAKSKPLSFALPVLANIKLSKRQAKGLGIV
jgi:uncharacterized protein YuzE